MKKVRTKKRILVRPKNIQRCFTMEKHWILVRKDPEYRWRSLQIEREVKDWARKYSGAGARTGLIRIPVVVHVIYNTNAQNISDAQINSQIAVLNADFRRLNTDAASTPTAFAGVAADARLEFALAVRDPNCNQTTGITRTKTSVTGWTRYEEGMKSTASGGHDPWDVNKYLNIWIANYTDGLLGYGTFPGMPNNIQGVTCDYRAFGTTGGTLTNHAHLGRTMTHEIGHWLNLLHVWGDDNGACTGSDECDDTPNQSGPSPFGPCQPFPTISCSNAPNGNMFMNYLDYSGDECMNMFTADQVARMDATLHTVRASILASDGLVPATGSPQPDLWMKDTSDDFGEEPNPSTQHMYLSDDIWVRKTNDGLLNQDHENPEYRPSGSPSNFVYVRVRNRGCQGIVSGTLKLYWAKASPSLSWPSPWDGSVSTPAVMGGSIGSQSVSVAAGDDEVLIFPWMPPNPADYASFGADKSHFCLLTRIETDNQIPYGMTYPETSDLYANVKKNNNIVWKNITVVDDVSGSGRLATTIIANFRKEQELATLEFEAPKEEDPSIFDWGKVFLEIPKDLIKRRVKDVKQVGLKQIDDTFFWISGPRAVLGAFKLEPKETYAMTLRFLPTFKRPMGVRVFNLDILHKVDGRVIGGQRCVLKTHPDKGYMAIVKPTYTFNGVTWVPICEEKTK